jgi:hypothetical protein
MSLKLFGPDLWEPDLDQKLASAEAAFAILPIQHFSAAERLHRRTPSDR